MKPRYFGAIICTLLISLMAPCVSSNSSGINFIGVTHADSSVADTKSVTISSERNVIASSYSKTLEFHNLDTLEFLNSSTFTGDIYDIQISPDDNYLAINLRTQHDSIQVMNLQTGKMKSEKGNGNDRQSNIDWSPNSEYIIAPNMNNGANIYQLENMTITSQLMGQHVSDITCVKYSKSGNYIMTADELGRINIWNNQGEYQEVSFDVNEEVTGCDFSQSDDKLAIITSSGNLHSFSLSGSDLQSLDLGDSHEIKWSVNSDRIFVLESDNNPELIVLDGSTFEEISSVRLLHRSLDFGIIEDQGVISKLFVATDSNHIAAYGTPTIAEGFGIVGSDLDGDNIPDALDNDDDGDSHLDDWDFNCQTETDCSRSPDLNTLRSYQIQLVGDTLVINDIYTINAMDTYTFRNLSRRSIISDQQISYEETNLIETAICHNMDKNDYISKLRSSIELSIGQITNGSIECQIIQGLSFTKWDDKEQIKFAFKTTFDIIPNVSLPVSLEIVDQISVAGSSITHLAENHPVYIIQIQEDGLTESNVWYNYGENPLLNYSSIEDSENQIDTIIIKLGENITTILIVIIASILSVWLIIRRNNLSSTILDVMEFSEIDEDDDDYEPNQESEISEDNDDISEEAALISKPELVMTTTNSLDYEEDSNLMMAQDDDNPNKRNAFTLDDDLEAHESSKIKRRSGKIQRNKQGPVTSTKRKRLDGKLDIPGEKIVAKKKVVKPKKRKVRRVKSEDEQ